MNEPAAEAPRSDPRQRLYDWIGTVGIVLAIGPPIGGLVFGLFVSVVMVLTIPEWEIMWVVPTSAVASYVLGLPIAAVAIALFLLLSRFTSRGTVWLAVSCGVASAALLVGLFDITRRPVAAQFELKWPDLALLLLVFGIPSGISAWVCWRVTRPLHRLS